MRKLIFILVFCLSAALFATDEILDRLPIPPQACHVLTLTQKGAAPGRARVVGGCSATVVGKRKLLFAAHCVPDEKDDSAPFSFKVLCPGEVEAMVVGQPSVFPRFDRAAYQRFEALRAKRTAGTLTQAETDEMARLAPRVMHYDLAMVTVEKDLGIDPAMIPKDETKFREVLRQKRCLLCGYGADAMRPDGEPRRFRGLAYSPEEAAGLRGFGEFPRDNSRLALITERAVVPGDSGGGLLCRDERGNWYAMSVFSASHSTRVQKSDNIGEVVWSDRQRVNVDNLEMATLTNSFIASEWAERGGATIAAPPPPSAPLVPLTNPAPPAGPAGRRPRPPVEAPPASPSTKDH